MIKCKIMRDKSVKVEASGTAKDLMVETLALIKNIANEINKKSPEAAYEYRRTLIGVLLDPNSPVWKGE